ncbi:MAG: hypothetical protein JWP27_844 [Flaviaesturariibacter sp.]|nr:hypothetical protein [Flaviaesturariibacter sp.]
MTFTPDGKLKSPFPSSLDRSTAFDLSVTQPLTAAAKEDIRKKLQRKFQNTIDNLTEPAAKSFYTALWSEADYQHLLAEATALRNYLKRGSLDRLDTVTIRYFPKTSDIDALLNSPNLFKLDTSFNAAKEQLSVKLTSTDALKEWLRQRFNAQITRSDLNQLEIGAGYRRNWDNLSGKLQEIAAMRQLMTQTIARGFQCNLSDINSIETFRSDLYHTGLLRIFREDTLYKSWLWFTEGMFNINPFGFTTPDRVWMYPGIDSVNSARFDEAVRKSLDDPAGCCDGDPKKIEALVKASGTGKQLFKKEFAYSDETLGITTLDALQRSKRIRNEISWPVTEPLDSKWKSVLMPTDSSYLLNYDAANDYKLSTTIPKAIAENEKAFVLVHNVPEDMTIKLVDARENGVDQSNGEKVAGELFEQVGSAVTLLNPVGAAWALVRSKFANASPAVSPRTISPTYDWSESVVVLNKRTGQKSLFNKNSLDAMVRLDDDVIRIDQTLTSENVIREYADKMGISRDTAERLILCGPPRIDYDSARIDASVKNVLAWFEQKLSTYRTWAKSTTVLPGLLKNDSLLITTLLAFPDRSLPPDTLAMKTNDKPVYRTVVFEPDLSSPPAKNKFTLTETAPKASGGDTTRVIAKKEVRSGKLFRFDVSAGIAYTFTDYTANIASTSGNTFKVKADDDQLRLIAGLHIYPWQLFKQDDSFLGITSGHFRNRVSLFVGVGIPEPLRNYYTGIGFDLIPGFKLTVGAHLVRSSKYKIVNNEVEDEQSGVRAVGPFASFTLQPATLVKLLGFVK